jgi:two-component system nitrogen regulation response regulator GlnG
MPSRPLPLTSGRPGGRVTADRPFKEVKEELVAAFERDYLADLLARADGNVSHAAENAGIDRVHLHRLMKKHGIVVK